MAMGRPFTTEEHEIVIRMLDDGEPYSAIGLALNRDRQVVWAYCKRHRLNPPRQAVVTPEKRRKVDQLYRRGVTIDNIIRRCGVSKWTVYHTIRNKEF